jgi:hypothetical protein
MLADQTSPFIPMKIPNIVNQSQDQDKDVIDHI